MVNSLTGFLSDKEELRKLQLITFIMIQPTQELGTNTTGQYE